MGRRKAPEPEKEQTAAEYYRLNTRAIDDLVTATPENSPKVSEQELRKYRSGLKINLREWVKVLLIKWWFAGMVCFFFFWGLGMMVPNAENQMIILGIGLGAVTDLLVNSIFRYYEKTPGANDRWMMVRRRGAAGLLLNVLYAFVLLACVVATYQAVNTAWAALSGRKDQVAVGVEPILFGLLTAGWDFLFLGFRRLGKRIIADAAVKNKRS